MHRWSVAAVIVMLSAGGAARAAHPLDPLSGAEIDRLVQVLTDAGHADAGSRYPYIGLDEPAKAQVHAWRPGQALARKGFAVMRKGREVFETVVDLGAGAVERFERQDGVQTTILYDDWAATQAVFEDADFMAALARRGINDAAEVFCSTVTMGYFPIPAYEGKRLLKVGCYDLRPSTNNVYGWPIEGLYAVVDLDAAEVLELHDSGVVPISPADLNFTEGAVPGLRPPMKPVTVATPSGGNLSIDGHEVGWQKWKLHVSLDRRVGLVVAAVRYDDRPVMYQGYVSEMFVPYHDPSYGWYSRTYFDTGEYGAGLNATALQPGIDCPEGAHFMSATVNDDRGSPLELPGVICLFERNTGDPVWRHTEPFNGSYEGRPEVELVARFIPTIGNYDYVVDFVLDQAGEITGRVGATGIVSMKGVPATSMADATAAADTATGTLVAPNLVAVSHDHFLSFRLDLDVDGPANTLVRDRYVKQRIEGPRRSMYTIAPEPILAAGGFELGHEPAKWRLTNPGKTNALGSPVGYELIQHAHARHLMDPEDWPARRGAFASKDLWVTGYDPAQKYAAGDYPLASKGDDGLGAWTKDARPIANEDLVLWVTVGFNHMTRPEDIPVMPTAWHEFTLRPFNFHDRNPALDVRSQFAGE